MIRTDPVLLEILRNRFHAIAEEIATVTLRTAFTVFVKETSDFGACLVSPGGEVFAAPTDTAVSLMIGLPAKETIAALPAYQEGDIGITNDPVLTKGLSTHLPDIWLWKPVFSNGEIIAFAFNFIHSSDVGGKAPGSISPTNSELFQEGIRIPPSKLYRAGILNQELLDIVLLNSRIPHQNWGDIKSQVASLNTAERRIHEIVRRYSHETAVQAIADLLELAEQRARAIIKAMPDGRYSFAEYVEGDVAGGRPVRMKLAIEVRDSDIYLDFTGTDLQVPFALNLPTWNQKGHYQLTFALTTYFRTLEPDIPYNSGLIRPIHQHIPAGTFLNPEGNVAVGVRAATSLRVTDCITGCLTQALPDSFPAASSGGAGIVLVSTIDVGTGQRLISVAQPLLGGSGARPMMDGVDGTSFTGGWLRNIPNEVLESDMPVLVEKYGYQEDTGGAGRYRGGASLHFRLKLFSPDTVMTARGLERFSFRPFGVRGGRPGVLGRAILNPGTPTERALGKIDVLELTPGDVVDFQTASGGGIGDPFRRDPAAVLDDVEHGLVSLEAAHRDYGVVISRGQVDEAATRRARAERGTVEDEGLFDVGPERRAYESVWTDELQTGLVTTLLRHPLALRPYLQQRAIAGIEGRLAQHEMVTLADIERLADDVLTSLNADVLELTPLEPVAE